MVVRADGQVAAAVATSWSERIWLPETCIGRCPPARGLKGPAGATRGYGAELVGPGGVWYPELMRAPTLRTACLTGALVFSLSAQGAGPAGTSSILDWRPQEGPGPTRVEARAATVASLLHPSGSTSILSRYHEFELDFGGDFGVEGLARDRDGDVLTELQERLDARWGDATFYQWIERGVALYARIQASTQIRRKGFDMNLEMDDVAEGKLGVRVHRALD